MSKRTCFIFQPIFPHFFRYIGRPEGPDTDIVASSGSVTAISSIVFLIDISWRSYATTLMVELGLFSSLGRYKSVTTCFSIFCPLAGSAEVSVGLHCRCKIVISMFLHLAATSSSFMFASFAFLRLLEQLE